MDIPIFFSVPSEAANDHSQKKEKKEAANDRSIEQKQTDKPFLVVLTDTALKKQEIRMLMSDKSSISWVPW